MQVELLEVVEEQFGAFGKDGNTWPGPANPLQRNIINESPWDGAQASRAAALRSARTVSTLRTAVTREQPAIAPW